MTKLSVWWKEQRPEIVEDFEREVYGRVPKAASKVNWEVTSSAVAVNGDVPVKVKKLVGHIEDSSYPQVTVDIQLSLTTPANAPGPVPVIMEFGFTGFPRMAAKQGPPPGPTWQEQVLA